MVIFVVFPKAHLTPLKHWKVPGAKPIDLQQVGREKKNYKLFAGKNKEEVIRGKVLKLSVDNFVVSFDGHIEEENTLVNWTALSNLLSVLLKQMKLPCLSQALQ